MQLEGRVALVTGASRGVGHATALALAKRGVALVLAARTLEPDPRIPGSLAETCTQIAALGGEALPVACNLSDINQVHELAAQALGWKGRVDLLVNNAAYLGKGTYASLDEITVSNWERQLTVNVTAPLLLTKAVVPEMQARGSGVIVNLTSGAAELRATELPGISYGATKAALNRLTIAMARDLLPDGIAVFAVEPGYVRTPIAEQTASMSGHDIEEAHEPEVPAAIIVELVTRDADQVSGRIWYTIEGEPPLLKFDGTR